MDGAGDRPCWLLSRAWGVRPTTTRPTASPLQPRPAGSPPSRLCSSPGPAPRGCSFARSWFFVLLFHAKVGDFASSRTAERLRWAGLGLTVGWALFALRNPRVQFGSGLRVSPGQTRWVLGCSPAPLSRSAPRAPWGSPPPGEAAIPGLFKE